MKLILWHRVHSNYFHFTASIRAIAGCLFVLVIYARMILSIGCLKCINRKDDRQRYYEHLILRMKTSRVSQTGILDSILFNVIHFFLLVEVDLYASLYFKYTKNIYKNDTGHIHRQVHMVLARDSLVSAIIIQKKEEEKTRPLALLTTKYTKKHQQHALDNYFPIDV